MGRKPNNSVDSSPFEGAVKGTTMPFWDDSELRKFYQAYHRHGSNWGKVVKALSYSKTDEDCEILWRMQRTLLSLQNNKMMEDAFVASVADAQDNVHRTSTPRHGPNETNKASDSNHSGSTSSLQATAKRRRTPRIRKTGEAVGPTADTNRGRGSPAHVPQHPQATPTNLRKAPGTPTWPNGCPSALNGSPNPHRTTPAEPPSSGHKRKRHRKLFEDDASPLHLTASGCMSPERPSSHNSTLQNGQKRNNPNWPRGSAGGTPEQPHEDVGAADALLSLRAMPRTGCPPPPSSTPNASTEVEAPGRLPRYSNNSQQEDEGESPEKAPGGPANRLLRKATRKEPARKGMMRSGSGDDYQEVGCSTPPTASPSTSYPGMAQADRLESVSGQVTSAMKHMRGHIASSAEGVQANSTPGPSSDNAMLTITVPTVHDNAREVSSLGADPSTASEGAGPSSQLSGGPALAGHDPLLSGRHAFMAAHATLLHPQLYPHELGHHHLIASSSGLQLPTCDAQRRVVTPVLTTTSGRWPQQMQPSSVVQLSARRSQRKPLPEKLPAMVPPLSKLLSKTSLLGAPSSFIGYGGSSTMGSFASQGHSMRQFVVGETGERMGPVEVTLRHSLSMRLRRWCMYEYLFSAIDRPYFMRNEWMEFLRYAGLGGVTKLTRTEWSLIRSGSFGKPRRLSQAFLKTERLRLEAYRETVRMMYENTGGSDLPINMPKPLHVGQHVTARHPTTRQIHDGVILTVANKGNRYRVQFNRTELMTEMVRDVDIMPVDPNENLPPAMLPLSTTVNGRLSSALGPQRRRNGLVPMRNNPAGHSDARVAHAPANVGEPASEADASLTLEVQMLLNMKEALLAQLRSMNNQAEASRDVRRAHDFQKDYSTVMVQLGQVNDQLKGSLEKLLGQQPHLLGMVKPASGLPPADSAPILQTLQSASPMRGSPTGVQPITHPSDAFDTPRATMQPPEGPSQGDAATWPGPPTSLEVQAIVQHALQEARGVVSQCSLKRTDHPPSTNPRVSGNGPMRSQPTAQARTAPADSMYADNVGQHVSNMDGALKQTGVEADSAGASLVPALEATDVSARPEVDERSVKGGPFVSAEAVVARVPVEGQQPGQAQGQPREGVFLANAGGSMCRQAWVDEVITGCVGMLFTVQQCTCNNIPVATMEGALELVLQSLTPRVASNLPVFQDIAAAVSALKVQLANST